MLLFDVTHGLAHRVPLTKLVELDGDVHPYLATLMVAALARRAKPWQYQKERVYQ